MIAGNYRTCNHDSSVQLDYNNNTLFCDETLGYFQRKILNNDSVVSEKLTNSTEKLCNDGEHSIFDLEQNGNSEFKWSEFNATCEYHLKNHSTNFDENNKPSVFKDVKSASSKNHISSKETQKKIIAGKNCNGLFNVNLKDESEYHKSCSNRNIEMIKYE